MGIYIGSGLAYSLGGWVVGLVSDQDIWQLPLVGATRSWQVIFFVVGIPGVLLALLMYTVREPLRRGARLIKAPDGKTRVVKLPIREVLSYLSANRTTFICHNVGFALLSFSSYGASAWIPTFFIRNHGWSASKAGIVYGLIVGIFSTLGVAVGGRLADWLATRGHRDANMRIGLLVAIVWAPTGILYTLVPDGNWAALLLIPTAFLASAPFGVAPAAIQQMMPNEMRGQASAVYLFVVNLIGLGLGPTAVAFATDKVFNNDYAVNYSLLLVTTLAHAVSAVLLWVGLKPFRRSLELLEEWRAANA
jgi:MFS family permease